MNDLKESKDLAGTILSTLSENISFEDLDFLSDVLNTVANVIQSFPTLKKEIVDGGLIDKVVILFMKNSVDLPNKLIRSFLNVIV